MFRYHSFSPPSSHCLTLSAPRPLTVSLFQLPVLPVSHSFSLCPPSVSLLQPPVLPVPHSFSPQSSQCLTPSVSHCSSLSVSSCTRTVVSSTVVSGTVDPLRCCSCSLVCILGVQFSARLRSYLVILVRQISLCIAFWFT